MGGGGEVFINILANIEGSNNISLQDFGNTNNVPNSITFHGDNTQYDGIFYLHPDINTITFETENSLIKRLNIPSINNQIRDITINIPSNLYASIMNIVKVPDNLSIKFYRNRTTQPLPNQQKLQNLIKHCSECSMCKDLVDSHKITSKSYEKYKQSEIKDLEEILHILQDLLTKLNLNKDNNTDNNNENINNIQINEDTNIEELLEKTTNILNQLGINEDNNNENIDTNNVQNNIGIKEGVNIRELIRDMSKLSDNIIKVSVKDRIVNILVKQYIKSFSKRLKLLGYKVELNKMHNKIIINNSKNGNKYKIRLEGEDTLEVVEKVVKDLASNFTVEAIKDVIEDSKKEKEEDVAEERERIKRQFNNDLSKLKVKDFKCKIEGIENILEILEKLIEKVERNKEQDINKEMKNLLSNKDKNWININKRAKENLKILKERTESDVLSEMNSSLTIFKDSYGYKEKEGYKTSAKNKLEIKGTIGDLKKCIDKKIKNITSELENFKNKVEEKKENEINQQWNNALNEAGIKDTTGNDVTISGTDGITKVIETIQQNAIAKQDVEVVLVEYFINGLAEKNGYGGTPIKITKDSDQNLIFFNPSEITLSNEAKYSLLYDNKKIKMELQPFFTLNIDDDTIQWKTFLQFVMQLLNINDYKLQDNDIIVTDEGKLSINNQELEQYFKLDDSNTKLTVQNDEDSFVINVSKQVTYKTLLELIFAKLGISATFDDSTTEIDGTNYYLFKIDDDKKMSQLDPYFTTEHTQKYYL